MQKVLIILIVALALGGIYYFKTSYNMQPAPSYSPTSAPTSNPTTKNNCVVGGCNGELCLDKEANDKSIASICVYKPQFACYKNAVCEKQASGVCGWTQTKELQTCLKNPTTY